ncbi:histidine-phosphotransfer domain, HPT domain-containing protein [Suillus fuscotomentosus]|uniref:Histidine-phosphotransfer domain, HPT domain-containing protein n=1 Tax=Suillus fuscotomentosus TaxID=1912939 RepID=A0AAD4E1T7_9AGAM|nr:histidine-phosphotransfer domain, HPT domain-containing protein [Suillus fuscotomentosus]KAG1834215.1 histidine-phosphotransfer domain, HPT domain-containing protein [Suillus variegatus]KAG1898164.1 histidine-phosphotransfer domain, HPT domain-containing protein [Suillus fuscotomentosus]
MSPALRARSPNIIDDIVKRPPPSPSDKAPPQKKLDVKSRPASEESTPKAASPITPAKEKSDLKEVEKKENKPSKQDIIDMEVFDQIVELDDGDSSFVSAMVTEYLGQVDSTFNKMDKAMETKDLIEISQLGHFLKGSSAALGVKQVSLTCEKIQNIAKGTPTDKTIEEVTSLLKRVKEEYGAAKIWLLEYCPT